MRKPERCEDCGYVHMPDESCRAPIACMTCGSPAGFYYIDKGNPDRECHNCFKERTR
jgi:hypothetical protein